MNIFKLRIYTASQMHVRIPPVTKEPAMQAAQKAAKPAAKPAKRPSRWNLTQLVERLHSLARDLRALAADIQSDHASAAAVASWHREHATYVDDMRSLLAGEMPGSDAALAKAEDLRGVSQVLQDWAASPTDRTGTQGRAAQLCGVSASIDAFATGLL